MWYGRILWIKFTLDLHNCKKNIVETNNFSSPTKYSVFSVLHEPTVQNHFIRLFTTLFDSNTRQFTYIVYLKFYGFWYVADDNSKVNLTVSIRPTLSRKELICLNAILNEYTDLCI